MLDHIPTIHYTSERDRFPYHVTCKCGWSQGELQGADDPRVALAHAVNEHFDQYREENTDA